MRIPLRSALGGVRVIVLGILICSCSAEQKSEEGPIPINVVGVRYLDDGGLVMLYYEVDKPPLEVEDVDRPIGAEMDNERYKEMVVPKEMSAAVDECFGNDAKQLLMSSVNGGEIRFEVRLKPPK
jgi:hypothetical protein